MSLELDGKNVNNARNLRKTLDRMISSNEGPLGKVVEFTRSNADVLGIEQLKVIVNYVEKLVKNFDFQEHQLPYFAAAAITSSITSRRINDEDKGGLRDHEEILTSSYKVRCRAIQSLLAIDYLKKSDDVDPIEVLRDSSTKGILLDPSQFPFYMCNGDAKLNNGSLKVRDIEKQAITVREKADILFKSFLKFARTLEKAGRFDEAERIFKLARDRGIDIGEDREVSILEKKLLDYAEGRTSLSGDQVQAYSEYLKQGQHWDLVARSAAIKAFEKLLRENPDEPLYKERLSRSLYELAIDAIDVESNYHTDFIRRVLVENPTLEGAPYAFIGEHTNFKDNPERIYEGFRRALATNPNDNRIRTLAALRVAAFYEVGRRDLGDKLAKFIGAEIEEISL